LAWTSDSAARPRLHTQYELVALTFPDGYVHKTWQQWAIVDLGNGKAARLHFRIAGAVTPPERKSIEDAATKILDSVEPGPGLQLKRYADPDMAFVVSYPEGWEI